VYQDQTRPLVDFYRNLAGDNAPAYHCIAGVGSVDTIKETIFSRLAP
jgi:adenylate kinase